MKLKDKSFEVPRGHTPFNESTLMNITVVKLSDAIEYGLNEYTRGFNIGVKAAKKELK
tara:strand:- start:1153 stop:1326 length:174 start_codon:yes stop_codon:yes gene_type:complete